MSEREFRIGDTVTMRGEIVWQSQDGEKVRVTVGQESWLVNVAAIDLVERKISIGGRVTGANEDPNLLDVAGEVIGIHCDSAWIRRDDGTYTVCPLAGLKAV